MLIILQLKIPRPRKIIQPQIILILLVILIILQLKIPLQRKTIPAGTVTIMPADRRGMMMSRMKMTILSGVEPKVETESLKR